MFDGGLPFNKTEIEELKKFMNYIRESKLSYDKRLYFPISSLAHLPSFLSIFKELDLSTLKLTLNSQNK